MEGFDHKQTMGKVDLVQNGKSIYGSMLLMQYCPMFVKNSGDALLVTLAGGGKFLRYMYPLDTNPISCILNLDKV